MNLFWISVLVLIVVIILYTVIHRLLINRATMIVRNHAQVETDRAVNAAVKALLHWDKNLSSVIVADVWGKGVLAFEYHFDYQKNQVDLTKFTREKLAYELKKYAHDQSIQAQHPHDPLFVITDWWTYEHILHIDVACLTNEATIEYVEDLNRLKNDQNMQAKKRD